MITERKAKTEAILKNITEKKQKQKEEAERETIKKMHE